MGYFNRRREIGAARGAARDDGGCISRSHQDQQADDSELASGNGNPVRLIQIKRCTSMTPVGSSIRPARAGSCLDQHQQGHIGRYQATDY
jgi:hypothetical protein